MSAASLIFAAPSGPSSEITDSTSFARWQYELILYGLVVALFALFAAGVYSLVTRSEISKQYRSASVISSIITWVAALAYLALTVVWLTKWHSNGAGSSYSPEPGTIFTGLRFADWTVTVPLLAVELFAVCNLSGPKAMRTRFAAMAAAFLMIITGLFGAIAVGQNNSSNTELVIWGLISTVFFIALYPLMLGPVRKTMKEISAPAGVSLRNATILLLSVWGAYPLVYIIWLFTDRGDSGWATTAQVVFTAADIVAKVGYGVLLHKVAKLRTAEDAGDADAQVPDTFPAAVSINGVSISLPGVPFSPEHDLVPAARNGNGTRSVGGSPQTGDGAHRTRVTDDPA